MPKDRLENYVLFSTLLDKNNFFPDSVGTL